MRIEFAQSARKHRVGRARALEVINDPVATVVLRGGDVRQDRLVYLGYDGSGRALEVMAVETDRGLLVIHVMDLRPKWRRMMEEGLT